MAQMSAHRQDRRLDRAQAGRRRAGDGKKHPNTCPGCGSHYRDDELAAHLRVCPQCGHHFPVRAPERIEQLADAGSFVEDDADAALGATRCSSSTCKPYTERLAEAEVVDRARRRDGHRHAPRSRSIPCRLAVMDFSFMGGSMGSVVGEKFARACESAAEDGLPLVSVSASGGARMQEGILSLMQLPKTVCAVEELHDAGGVLDLACSRIRRPAACWRASRQPRRRDRSPSRAR